MIQKLWLMLLGIARVGDGDWLTLLEAENSCLCWTLVAITMEAGQPMLSVPKTRKHSFAVLQQQWQGPVHMTFSCYFQSLIPALQTHKTGVVHTADNMGTHNAGASRLVLHCDTEQQMCSNLARLLRYWLKNVKDQFKAGMIPGRPTFPDPVEII